MEKHKNKFRSPKVAKGVGAGTGNPPAGPCNLITRFDGWEAIVPLQFIPMEDLCRS